MAMSLRERTREVAVLKAIGFSRMIVLSLVLVEAVVIAVGGGLVGVMTARPIVFVQRRDAQWHSGF